ncbi:MAG TPA: histidine kinase [Chitinophagaceae bacterium]|nr:histidine kinase [Chitinophagaceae bacterium]
MYTTKDGLSNNTVNAVTQDKYGYIWIATGKGLNRFDGTTFQQFYSDSGRNSLPEDYILNLKWLDDERLAIITNSELHIINIRTLEQRNLVIPPDSLISYLPVNKVFDAYSDKKRNIFIVTATGFYQFNARDELIFRYDHFSRKYIEGKNPVAFGINITPLEDNILLISSFKGPYLYYIDKKDFHPPGIKDDSFYQQIGIPQKTLAITHSDNNSFSSLVIQQDRFCWFDKINRTFHHIKAPFKISEYLDGGIVTKLIRLNDTLFAVNTILSGFCLGHYNGTTDSYELLPQLYFKNIFCKNFLLDKNNQLWIATNSGLFKEKRSTSVVEQINTPTSFSDFGDQIQSLVVSNNKILAGTLKKGLLIFDSDSLKQSGRLDFKRERKNLPTSNIVNQLIPINNDTVFVSVAGTWINTKNLTKGAIPISAIDTSYESIDLIFKDSHSNIYLKKEQQNLFYFRSSNDNSLKILDYRTELSKIGRDIKGMAEDGQGNIWFSGSGIMRFNHSKQIFDLLLDSFPVIRTPHKGIVSNLVFDGSLIYFGVYGSGLIIYDQKQKKISALTRRDGLPDNGILSLLLHKGKLWIGTESGLASYELATKKISSFGTADGIPVTSGTGYPLIYDSVHRQIYGALRSTIFRFDPDKLIKNNIPPVFGIENIVIAGKETIYHPDDNIRLSYKQNNLVINLAAVNFEDAFQQQFAFRLVKDRIQSWQEIGSQKSIIFSNLKPGAYTFQVKAYIRNQSWPDQTKQIIIIIRPPFWERWWFILLSAVVILLMLYLFYRSRVKTLIQKATIDRQLTDLELKGLHAQMNPHFIFNCLNSIREMILNNENQQASHYLNKFAQLIRITLNQSSKQFISLRSTVDYLERYIEMEKIRNTKFNCTIEVDEQIQSDEYMIPPMLIQPFIENAIWHGSVPERQLQISVRFRKEGDRLACDVEDNGPGIGATINHGNDTHAGHRSIGISNVKERIKVLNEKYKLHSELRIEDKSRTNGEQGTIVKLYFSLKSIAI